MRLHRPRAHDELLADASVRETFGLSNHGFLGAYARYVVVGAVVAGLTVVLLAGFVEGLGLGPRPAQALALTLLAPLSFVLSMRFAFRLSPDVA